MSLFGTCESTCALDSSSADVVDIFLLRAAGDAFLEVEGFFLRSGEALADDFFLSRGEAVAEDFFFRSGEALAEDDFLPKGLALSI